MWDVMVIETGMGVDLQGQDPTKAALRAARDAIGRVYLPAMRRLTGDGSKRMMVRVRLAAPPEAGEVDQDAVRAAMPHGEVTVEVQQGGMLTPGGLDDGARICIVVAAVEVGVAAVDG